MKKIELLIVEDSITLSTQLKDLVTSLGYVCIGVVNTGAKAIEQALLLRPDIILMDIWLAEDMNGVEAAAEINKQIDTTVIFLTSSSDLSLMETLKLSKGSSYMVKPVDPVELQFNIELSLAKFEADQQIKDQQRWQEAILESVIDGVIAEDEFGRINYINQPGRKLLDVNEAYTGKQISDYFNAFDKETGEDITKEPTHNNVECQIVTHMEKSFSVIMKIANISSNDGKYLGRVVTLTNITEELELQGRVNYLTFHDSMTGLYNRNYLDEEIDRLNTTRQLPITIIMADLNGLKISNDLMGHDEGDNIIRMTADVLRNACRSEDIIARIGGDEFLIFLPETDESEAEVICKRIQAASERRGTKLGKLSIAVGYCTKTHPNDNIRLCMNRADEDMYAKKSIMKRTFFEETFQYLFKNMATHPYEGFAFSSKVKLLMTEMCLLDREVTHLVKEAILLSEVYDIGMLCLDDEIYSLKLLDEDDRKVIRRHCESGAKIVDISHQYQSISKYILYHHHRYDGMNTTDGVKGDSIPVLSRMLAVVDSYVAITSERVYRDSMKAKQAANEIAKGSGSQFDPWAVDLFFKVLNKLDQQ